MASVKIIAQTLRTVVNLRLQQSHIAPIWRDDHTWNTLASELLAALADKFAVVEKSAYNKLVADAAAWARVEASVRAYRAIPWQGKKG